MREDDIKYNQHHSPQKITAQYKAQVSGAGAPLLQCQYIFRLRNDVRNKRGSGISLRSRPTDPGKETVLASIDQKPTIQLLRWIKLTHLRKANTDSGSPHARGWRKYINTTHHKRSPHNIKHRRREQGLHSYNTHSYNTHSYNTHTPNLHWEWQNQKTHHPISHHLHIHHVLCLDTTIKIPRVYHEKYHHPRPLIHSDCL